VGNNPSMSANLDLVRSIYAAWERGDYGSTEWAHPEIELVAASDGPDPGCWTGRAEIAQAWRDYLRVWEDHRSEAEEYREIDNERILVLISVTGRGKTSGMDLGQMQAQGANLFRIQGGQVTRLVLYTDRDRALADLGLTPEARHDPR
jgi:ketosteroid isomerase-like protein